MAQHADNVGHIFAGCWEPNRACGPRCTEFCGRRNKGSRGYARPRRPKRACAPELFLQAGIIFNYFTKFHADDFNPVVNEFFVQTTKEIGGYPMFDFFINAKIKTCRLYFKCEHFNSAWTGNNYLTATNYPYRDFVIRFGLEWNFFK
ncbi:MAG: hypothetical protein EOO38_24375 [Cytophagaceae bacterium]|nr:MAG: hypothetical protein EOO38_24375 [Cytophagaceae bacterium]